MIVLFHDNTGREISRSVMFIVSLIRVSTEFLKLSQQWCRTANRCRHKRAVVLPLASSILVPH